MPAITYIYKPWHFDGRLIPVSRYELCRCEWNAKTKTVINDYHCQSRLEKHIFMIHKNSVLRIICVVRICHRIFKIIIALNSNCNRKSCWRNDIFVNSEVSAVSKSCFPYSTCEAKICLFKSNTERFSTKTRKVCGTVYRFIRMSNPDFAIMK